MSDVLHHLDYRLSYSECDPAGIVYFGAYHPWMERVHTDWSYLHDVRADQMFARDGVQTVSRHSSVTYEHPARIFDAVRAEMRLGRLGTTSYTAHYDFLRRHDDRLLAMGTMTLVCLDADMGPVPVPERLRVPLLAAGPPREST